jgi:hypothetical protein
MPYTALLRTNLDALRNLDPAVLHHNYVAMKLKYSFVSMHR